MPPRWVHTFLDVISFGLELYGIHKSKDRSCKKLGQNHRKQDHILYGIGAKMRREGTSFCKIINEISPIAKGFERWVQEERHISAEEAPKYGLGCAAYSFHDLFDLLWDDLSSEERKVYEAGIREIWLNPQEFSNLFLPETFKKYFTSDEYKRQRKYLAQLNYDNVNKQELNDFLEYQKKLDLKKFDLNQVKER